MKIDLTNGTWQDNPGCPINITLVSTSDENKQLSADDKNEWKHVRILVIDEVSFMSNSILKTLNYKLMNIGNRSKSCG